MLVIGGLLAGFVRRLAGGYEENAIEETLPARRPRHLQMRIVNGIERAAENRQVHAFAVCSKRASRTRSAI